ncbi:MAG TPA: zinc ribbon domain-containing protein [Vicinamibacterales bacterium]|nr:zinc ribbon domain-containing protein [Vicinamibacterales bacterium]
MQCTSCGAEIADKAIVCYRCGAPTAIPAAPKRQQTAPAARRRPGWTLVVVALLGALMAVLGALVPQTDAGGGARTGLYAALAVTGVVLFWTLLRRR